MISGALCSAVAAPLTACDVAPETHADALHSHLLTLDSHVDIPLDFATPADDPAYDTSMQVDLPKMKAGGLEAAFFIVFTPQGAQTAEGYKQARSIADTRATAIHRMAAQNPSQIGVVTAPAEARRLWRLGKRAAFIGMENAYPLGESLDDVALWKARGVRYLGLTHVGHNQFADSANPNPAIEPPAVHNGLSSLGRELVEALNDAGIIIDVSHASQQTTAQAIAQSRVPIIASHAAARALVDNPRNINDEDMVAMARKGGVIQIVALGSFLRSPSPAQSEARLDVRARFGIRTDAERAALDEDTNARYVAAIEAVDAKFPPVRVGDLIDHVDHVAKLVGVDHVGVASDFGGGGGVEGWNDASQCRSVTRELVRRKYSDSAIEKIWGGNLLRVMSEVASAAR